MRTRAAADGRPRSSAAMVKALVEDLERRRYSASVLQQAHQVLPRFLSHLRERRRLDLRAVTVEDIESYARALELFRVG